MKTHLPATLVITSLTFVCGELAAEPAARTLRDFAERDERPVETIVYKKAEAQELRLLVCKPDGWKKGQKRPAMVWIHGGGWVAGAPEQFLPHMKYSAARGAVGLGVQYRLMRSSGYRHDKKLSDEENRLRKEAKFKAFMEGPSLSDCIADCGDAIRYVRQHAAELGIDPKRITAIGDSSGAHLAACLGTLAKGDGRANAVIACSSISDLTYGFGGNYVKPGPGSEGKELAEDPERTQRARVASPYHNIPKDRTSFLILHGKHDWLKDEPERFHAALRQAGVDSEYKVYPTARHAFIVYGYSATLEETTQALFDMDAFLLKRGLLDGPTSIEMPESQAIRKVIASVPGPITEKKTLRQDMDFPGFLTIGMKVKLPKKYNGVLVEMPGGYGFRFRVHDRGHDFTAKRLRQRGPQVRLAPEVWQDVVISLGKEKVIIAIDGKPSEIPNPLRHAFVGPELVFGDIPDVEIKEVEVHGYAMDPEQIQRRAAEAGP